MSKELVPKEKLIDTILEFKDTSETVMMNIIGQNATGKTSFLHTLVRKLDHKNYGWFSPYPEFKTTKIEREEGEEYSESLMRWMRKEFLKISEGKRFILVDEPEKGAHLYIQKRLKEMFYELGEGKVIICVTHSPEMIFTIYKHAYVFTDNLKFYKKVP